MAKGIKAIWIDSDTPESLGNKVIKDGVEIATVENGNQVYNDPNVVVNQEYKYVIQSYTATGQSTDEVLGVNMNYYTIVENAALTPIMTNFRVLEATPDRVYFDAPLGPVTGANINGFVVSGKGVLSIDTTNNYFTVDSDFTYWDNATIRLGENDNQTDVQSALHNFTLSSIDVITDFTEPAATTNRYVAPTAQGSGDGSSEANAATFTTAVANCSEGQTWWLKAGNYGSQFGYLSGKNGTATNPIKFKGYKTTIGDITSNYIHDFDDINTGWSTSEMPTFSGGTGSTYCILYNNSNYVFFEDIQVSGESFGIQGVVQNNSSGNLVFRRINGKNFGSEFMSLESVKPAGDGGDGYEWWRNDNCKIIDCRSMNAAVHGIKVYGDGKNLIESCKVWSDMDTVETHQDYFIAFNGNNNILRNCYTEFFNSEPGINSHGISIRGSNQLENNYNLIEKSTAINSVEGFAIRNYGCNYNVIKNCFAGNDKNDANDPKVRYGSGGFSIWGGVDYNIIENCEANNTRLGLDFIDNQEESNHTSDYIGTGNIIRNSIFYNNHYTININAQNGAILADTQIINCTFDNGSRIFERGGNVNNTNMRLINCQFTNMESQFTTTGATYSYSNFFGNGSNFVGSGTDNTNVDPDYEDTIDFVPQTEMLVPLLSNVPYDKNWKQRGDGNNDTTIGAVAIETVVPDTTPPTLDSITIENASPTDVVMVFNEAVSGTNLGFSLSGTTESTFASFSGSGNIWTGVLATAAEFGETITLSYSGGDIMDGSDNLLEPITNQAVTNNVTGDIINEYPDGNSASPTPNEANNRLPWIGNTTTVTSSTELVTNGTWAIKAVANEALGYARTYVELTVDSGQAYRITLDAARGATGSDVVFQTFQGIVTPITPTQVTSQSMSEFTWDVTTNATTLNVECWLLNEVGSTVYIDNVILQKI